jgi:GTP1/Obg family GTP-binding protein
MIPTIPCQTHAAIISWQFHRKSAVEYSLAWHSLEKGRSEHERRIIVRRHFGRSGSVFSKSNDRILFATQHRDLLNALVFRSSEGI